MHLSTDLQDIKIKLLELLDRYCSSKLHDQTVSSRQLFNFMNEDGEYRLRYSDVEAI